MNIVDKIKQLIKKFPKFKNFLIKKYKELITFNNLNKDRRFLLKNFLNNSKTIEKMNYSLLLCNHSIEKGFIAKDIRPFGKNKIKEIISLLEKYEKLTKEKNFEYNYSLSLLNEYKKLYEKNKWTEKEEYLLVKNFLKNREDKYDQIKAGSIELKYKDIEKDLNIDYLKFLSSRHSIRDFKDKKLDSKDIEKAINMAIKTPSACNKQMCKIYYVQNEEKKKLVDNYSLGLTGFDTTNANYFIITYDVVALNIIFERNQGMLSAGLVTMNFVNALHSLKIGSCLVNNGNSFKEEKRLKKQLGISKTERIAIIILAGYYKDITKVPCSSRKNISDVYISID